MSVANSSTHSELSVALTDPALPHHALSMPVLQPHNHLPELALPPHLAALAATKDFMFPAKNSTGKEPVITVPEVD